MAKKTSGKLDLTQGGIASNLIRFALPVMATSFLQIFYNSADLAVVGRFAGTQAQAAVGSSSPLTTVFIMLFVGLSVGSNVVIAQFHGAKDEEKVSRGIHNAIALAIVSGAAIMVLGLLLSRQMLALMGSPEDVIDLATVYVKIIFLGAPANMVYNFGSSVLRALGDSKRPMNYLAISGLVNVLLNLLLVIVFKMSVVGVAVATVASQVLSAVLVLNHLIRAKGSMHLDLRKLRLEKEFVKPIIRIGLPTGIQSSMFSISNAIIQSAVNAQGSLVMAGNSAAANLEAFVHLAMSAFATALLTFSSTNRGARLYPRVRRGIWVAMGTVTGVGMLTGLLVLYFGEALLSLYNADPEVIAWGMERMRIMLTTYFLCGVMEVASYHLRGLRHAMAPMLVSLIGVCGFRVLWIYTVYAANLTMHVLYISYPITWAVTFLAHMTCYFLLALPKLRREEQAYVQGVEQA